MSSSTGTETLAESNAVQRKPLPLGILNALDDSLNAPPPWIIEKLLAEGEQMLVFGAPKVGKSQFALQLACCLAMGRPFLGWSIARQRRVLYLNFEMGKRVFMHRTARHLSRLMEERRKRDCEESGREYVCEDDPWHKSEDEVPLGAELLAEINQTIRDHLFFCSDLKSLHGDHVSKPADSLKKGQGSNPKSDAEADQELLVRHWQSVIEEVKPDLVIFDTLSKTHSINESDNSEIQRVLLRIRQICSIPVSTVDDAQSGGHEGNARKDIAHIIVHHARKMPGEFSGRGNYLTLDNIRGGSAIRAEADLICGIFSANNKPAATHIEANRHLVVEARNFAPFEQTLSFEVFAFCHPRQRTPEEVEVERNNKGDKLDQLILGLVRDSFVQSGMRGLMIKTMFAKVWAGIEKAGLAKQFSKSRVKMMLESLAGRADSQFEIRLRTDLKKKVAKSDYEGGNGVKLYWIREHSPWLD